VCPGFWVHIKREDGYLYAGLYKKGTTIGGLKSWNVVVKDNVKEGEGNSYVAKFVPEGVMGIRAQVSSGLINNPNAEKSSVRFVTSIDSLLYKEVGFSITRVGDDGNPMEMVIPENVTNYVYEQLYGVDVTSSNPGEPMEYTPQDIHTLANYFKTYTITKVPSSAFNTDLTVTPYWVTHDGVKVEGTIAIKSVNFGRSWVYVNETANAGGEFGTYDHPFTNLSDALDAVLLENNGKVIIQGNSEIGVSSDFVWKKQKKTRNITILGENKTSSKVKFSGVSELNVNDGVVFDNITLVLSKNVYANGHDFIIRENVSADNKTTIIYGGGKKTTVAKTNIEIYAGSYKEVWGGGNGGTVSGDCNVTIKNANIYDGSKGDQSRVFGSGSADTVKGNVYVTIGGTFNKSYNVADFERNDHSRYSSVHAAGTGTVQGNTYLSIEDEAEVDYVYGGGATGSQVLGTCHVELKGGTIFSIYGGGKGDNLDNAGKNADTSVIVTGGKVCQIIGANGNSMTGNSYVEIAGGKVTRRIYGGCYNDIFGGVDKHYVTGYSTVVIKDETAVASLSGDDAGITAGSRSTKEHSDEKAVLICNNNSYANLKNKLDTSYNEYDYLVQANIGGMVSSIGERICVQPNEGSVATVRSDSASVNEGTVLAYITSEGMCKLPDLSAAKREVYVVFGTGQPNDVDVAGCKAKVGGTYSATLEDAIDEAKIISTKDKTSVVTLLDDVSISSAISLSSSDNITVQSEGDNKYTITALSGDNATSETQNVFTVADGTLTINNVALSGGYKGIRVSGTGEVYSTNGVNISGTKQHGIHVTNGTVTMSGLTISETGTQALCLETSAEATISNFSIGNTGSAAVRLLGDKTKVSLEGGTIETNSYGIYISDASVAEVKDVTITRQKANANASIVVCIKAQLTMSGDSCVDGNGKSGRGVVVEGTFNIDGGSVKNHIMTAGIKEGSLLTANIEDGVGVYVVAGGRFTMNGGSFESNTTKNAGGAIAVNGENAVFTMNDGIIENNTAKYGGAVMVRSGEFTMKGGTITGNEGTTSGGAICVSAGTFNMEKGIVSLNTSPKGGALFMNNASGTINLNANGTGAITNNTSTSFGGGIYVNKGNFNMDGCIVEKNTATTLGGGVYLDGGSVSICGGTICDNTAENGGGVYATSAAAATMNGGTISNNEATLGGGVYVPESASFTMCGGTISGNEATGQGGGGVYVLANGTFDMNAPVEGNNAGIIKENKAASGKYGAGVLVYGTFNMNEGTISNHGSEDNPLDVEGAGVCIYDNAAEFVMNGGEIRDNFSSKAGAGVSVRANAPIFTMNGGKITSNNSTTNAGGIVIRNNAVFTISNSAEISNNTASSTTGMGGGVYKEGSATLVLNGGLFAENSAAYGADIYYTGTISLSAPITSDVIINQGKTYKEGNIIATRAQAEDESYLITDEDFVASMKHIKVQPNSEGEWFVNDSGNLAKAYAEVLSTDKRYASFQEALEIANTADKADTITVLRDVTLTEAVTVENSLKLTSNSAVTITADAALEENMFTVAAEKTLEIAGTSADAPLTIIGGSAKVISNSGTTKLSNVNINGSETAIYNNGGTVGTNDNPITNVTISNTTGYSFYIHNGVVNAENLVIQGAPNRGIHIDGATQTVNVDGLQILDSGAIGLAITDAVQENTNITLKNAVIDNEGITNKATVQGIVAKGGVLNLDNVKIQNCLGTATSENGSHGITLEGAKLVVTTEETDDNGDTPGLQIYNVKGHGLYATKGAMNIAKILINGNSKKTRAGIRIYASETMTNVISNASITGCNADVQIKNTTLTINNTTITAGSSQVQKTMAQINGTN